MTLNSKRNEGGRSDAGEDRPFSFAGEGHTRRLSVKSASTEFTDFIIAIIT